jgi:uncharacterized protein YciI
VVDFLVYSRDAAGTAALRDDDALLERHWSYMDAFARSMVARGPTLRADRETATGSLHVLGLPDAAAARAFVADEPCNQAGLYAEHAIWRCENLLGRTMWEFARTADEPRFFVLVLHGGRPVPPEALPASLRDRLIFYGALSGLDDGLPAGVALALQASDRAAAELLLGAEPTFARRELHDWEFGGRR